MRAVPLTRQRTIRKSGEAAATFAVASFQEALVSLHQQKGRGFERPQAIRLEPKAGECTQAGGHARIPATTTE